MSPFLPSASLPACLPPSLPLCLVSLPVCLPVSFLSCLCLPSCLPAWLSACHRHFHSNSSINIETFTRQLLTQPRLLWSFSNNLCCGDSHCLYQLGVHTFLILTPLTLLSFFKFEQIIICISRQEINWRSNMFIDPFSTISLSIYVSIYLCIYVSI